MKIEARIIDFDLIEDWETGLRSALTGCVSDAAIAAIAGNGPKFVEDARNLLFEHAGRDAVIDATLAWIAASRIVAYHGTRLSPADIASVRARGLVPLIAATRRERVERALSRHPDWTAVQARIGSVLADFGAGARAGRREGQVHLTLSKAGLQEGFNHYLTHGAEFDQHVATELLGSEGASLLAEDGVPIIVRAIIAGDRALQAAHPIFSIGDLRSRGDVPNLVDPFLKAWSYRQANPGFDPGHWRLTQASSFVNPSLQIGLQNSKSSASRPRGNSSGLTSDRHQCERIATGVTRRASSNRLRRQNRGMHSTPRSLRHHHCSLRDSSGNYA